MKTYILDFFPKIKRLSQKINNLNLLKGKKWIHINDENTKRIFIFRDNNILLISVNGVVKTGRWEFIDEDLLLLSTGEDSFLYNHGFLDGNLFALNLDSTNEYLLFVNEKIFNNGLTSLKGIKEFVERKYIMGNSYQEPKKKYELLNSKKTRSSQGKKCESYEVLFDDGFFGEIVVISGKRFFFRDSISFKSVVERHYSNKESCIRALRYFLENGEISKNGYVETIGEIS